MDSLKNQLTLDKIITTKQWRRLNRELELLKKSGPDFFICNLVWNTGLRVSELTNLKWSDIDLNDEFLKVREGKGSKPRTVYFGAKVSRLLKDYKNNNKITDNESFVFTSQKRGPFSRVQIHRRFKTLLSKANLPSNLSFHSLRHGYATRMLDEGIQLHELKTQLGHSSIATTAIYLHFTESSREKFAKVC